MRFLPLGGIVENMKKNKTVQAMILCVLMCLFLLTGCGSSGTNADGTQDRGQQGDSAPGGTAGGGITVERHDLEEDEEIFYAEAIVIICNGEIYAPDPMHPAAGTIPTVWALTMIHDRLLALDYETGEIGPAIATQWNSSDNRTFRFTLRDDAVFHDGEKLTAGDVVYTISRGKAMPGSEAHVLWSQVETARVISDFEVELVLVSANAYFFSDLAMPVAGILSEVSISFDPDFGPAIGTGAYAVIDFRPGNYVQMVRNETYWGASENVITDWVRIQGLSDPSAGLSMMINDEAQVYYGVTSDAESVFEDDPENFNLLRHGNTIATVAGVGGIDWTRDAQDIDFREIRREVDYYY